MYNLRIFSNAESYLAIEIVDCSKSRLTEMH